jgi:hypothetical protein
MVVFHPIKKKQLLAGLKEPLPKLFFLVVYFFKPRQWLFCPADGLLFPRCQKKQLLAGLKEPLPKLFFFSCLFF